MKRRLRHTNLFRASLFAGVLLSFALIAGCYDDKIGDAIQNENNAGDSAFDDSPVPGNFGIMSATSITKTSVRIDWDKSSDGATPQGSLQYRIYYSTKNNVHSVHAAEANGTPHNAWTTDIDTLNITGLDPSTVYYMNVLVMNGKGKKSSYVTISVTTGGALVLFSAGTYKGNLVPVFTASVRNDLDKICSTSAVYGTLPCGNVRAFISATPGDSIAKLPANFGVPSDRIIQSAAGDKLADNWADLMDGLIDNTLQTANVANGFWWSGSDEDGEFDAAGNCSTWMDGTNSSDGREGAHNKVDSEWISRNLRNCNNSLHVLCICW